MHIDEHVLKRLYALSRIAFETDLSRQEKMTRDLSKILDYFTQLQEVKTDLIQPLAGGSTATNVYRDDISSEHMRFPELVGQFSDTEQAQLKIPPVF